MIIAALSKVERPIHFKVKNMDVTVVDQQVETVIDLYRANDQEKK
jgi:hypothetical protein